MTTMMTMTMTTAPQTIVPVPVQAPVPVQVQAPVQAQAPVQVPAQAPVQVQAQACAICAEGYNKSTRKRVACMYCAYEACRQCCQTYITTSTVTFPRCMNTACNREWTRKFLADAFPQTFLNRGWKTHREQVLLDQERALLPATQPLVEDILRCDRLREEISAVSREVQRLFLHRAHLNRELYALERRRRIGNGGGAGGEAREGGEGGEEGGEAAARRTFVRACPDADCRGFLSTQWKCGLCNKWTCPACHELKGPNRDAPHTCEPEQLATAALLQQDTRPCPSCGMGIYRIEGCSQMWCTQCNTAFCWHTGRIETRRIHNPHYFEWLRRGGGANADADAADLAGRNRGCERELTHIFVLTVRRTLGGGANKTPSYERTANICRNVIHLVQVIMPTYQVDHVLNNQHLRIEYLRNRLTDDQFRVRIQKDDKRHRKNQEILNVLQMMQVTCTDIMYRLLAELRSHQRQARVQAQAQAQGTEEEAQGTEEEAQGTEAQGTEAVRPWITAFIMRTGAQGTEEVAQATEAQEVAQAHVQLTEEVAQGTEEAAAKIAILDRYLSEVDRLTVYANECLLDVARAYGSVAFRFTPLMDMVRHYTARQESAQRAESST